MVASLFEPDLKRLDLWNPPASHRQNPQPLNVLRHLDMSQAIGLAMPLSIKVYVKDEAEAKTWERPVRLRKALGLETLQIRKVSN